MKPQLEELLLSIFPDPKDRKYWLARPNQDLEDESPLARIAQGKDDEVLAVLDNQLGNIVRNP